MSAVAVPARSPPDLAALAAGCGGAGALAVGVAFVGAGLDVAQQTPPPRRVGNAG
jgi:hypothetical protein